MHLSEDFNTTLVSVRHKYNNTLNAPFEIFQYNTCFGSTIILQTIWNFLWDFNTTLVSVRLCRLFCMFTLDDISIQHLFRFDGRGRPSFKDVTIFQYNTCFGSTKQKQERKQHNVKFQYNTCFGSTFNKIHSILFYIYNFNTTLVSVRQWYIR